METPPKKRKIFPKEVEDIKILRPWRADSEEDRDTKLMGTRLNEIANASGNKERLEEIVKDIALKQFRWRVDHFKDQIQQYSEYSLYEFMDFDLGFDDFSDHDPDCSDDKKLKEYRLLAWELWKCDYTKSLYNVRDY